MSFKKILWLITIFTATIFTAQAQTADDIINKHLDAIGGKDKLSQVNTIYMEGNMEVMGNDAPFNITIVNGKAMLMQMNFGGQSLIQCYTDTSGWDINPFNGSGGPEKMDNDEYKDAKYQQYFPDIFIGYPQNGIQVSLLGKEDSSYKIQVMMPDSITSTYYIDSTSYYITRVVGTGVMQGSEVTVNSQFSNFQKTDFGITVPFTVNSDFGNFSFSRTISKITFNQPVDSTKFMMPKQ